MREYEKKFRENTEMLNANNENLVIMLKELGVKDADIWISRCEAIVDSREMVEIRHELNQRRQMLRERIENNEKLKEGIISQLDAMINAHPEIKGELLGIIKEYSNV